MNFQLSVYIHMLAAITWIGGLVFLATVLVPLSRRMKEPPGMGALLLGIAARRFRIVSWIALVVLVGSGIWALSEKDIDFSELAADRESYLQALRIKMALVAAILTLSAVHDYVLGPWLARRLESRRASGSSGPAFIVQRRVISWIARINLVLALAAVAFGILLR